MATSPSASTPPSADIAKHAPRGLRDRPLGRLAILAVILLAAVLVARGCGSGAKLTKDDAIAIARPTTTTKFANVQVRYVQRGIPARGFWAVSFYNGAPARPTRFQLVLVDAKTGEVAK